MSELEYDKMVTVCDKCFCACCWQGYFMCDDNFSAGTTEKPISELKKLNMENAEYWEDKHVGDQT